MLSIISRYSEGNKNKERGIQLFVTFLFAIFFFQFIRGFLLNINVDRKTILVQTVIFLLWFGLSILSF